MSGFSDEWAVTDALVVQFDAHAKQEKLEAEAQQFTKNELWSLLTIMRACEEDSVLIPIDKAALEAKIVALL